MIKIYGSLRSSGARCFWLLEEIEQQYETIALNMKEKEHKSEEYLKLNPNGKVPTLIDGDFVIYESLAINTYLAEKYKPELLGKNIEEHALVQQWSVWAVLNPYKHIETIMYEQWGAKDADVIEKAKVQADHFLEILDTYLSNHEYLVGETFTLADLNVASVMFVSYFVSYDISKFVHLNKWLKTMSERPSYKKTNLDAVIKNS